MFFAEGFGTYCHKKCDFISYRIDDTDATTLLNKLYHCDYKALSKLTSSMQSRHSCTLNMGKFKSYDIQNLKKLCLGANVRFTKTLRITASNLKTLLAVNKELKVVYLYRDPRGIISSTKI